jgi:hypothetical protein
MQFYAPESFAASIVTTPSPLRTPLWRSYSSCGSMWPHETGQNTHTHTHTHTHAQRQTNLDRPLHGYKAARHEPDQVRPFLAVFRNPWVIHDVDGRDPLVGVVS